MLGAWFRRGKSRLLPTSWCKVLEANVPTYRRLPPALRSTLEQRVRTFLDGKRFEGCGGLTVTDEMRVTVAGHASLLLLRDQWGCYPGLGTVILYPSSFAAPIRTTDPVGIVTETIEERLGESWQEGAVVLAWESIEELLDGRSADCNVIIHEFAHQLDAQFGITDGAPLIALADRYRDWSDLLASEAHRQRTARRRGRPTVLDPYALTSAAELFAVATETFYQRPLRFKVHHPELHTELQAVYGVDPTSWGEATDG